MSPESINILLAGIFGGATRWAVLRVEWKDGLIGIFAGASCAYYLAPSFIPSFMKYFGVQQQDLMVGYFIAGALGTVIMGGIIDIGKAFYKPKSSTPPTPPKNNELDNDRSG